MSEKIIENYINQLTINDLIYFANNENYNLPMEDAAVIYEYGKKYWKIIYKGDPTNLFLEIKNKLTPLSFNKLIEIYKKYKNRN